MKHKSYLIKQNNDLSFTIRQKGYGIIKDDIKDFKIAVKCALKDAEKKEIYLDDIEIYHQFKNREIDSIDIDEDAIKELGIEIEDEDDSDENDDFRGFGKNKRYLERDKKDNLLEGLIYNSDVELFNSVKSSMEGLFK